MSEQALNKGLKRIYKETGLAGISPGQIKSASPRKKLAIFNKYRAVAEGKAHVVKLSPKMADRYERAGLKAVKVIAGNKAIVPIEPGYSKTKVISGEPILEGMISQTRSLPSGEIENILLPYPIDKISEFIREAKANPDWDKLKKKAEKFRFGFGDGTIDGTNWSGFRAGSLADVAEYLQGYAQIKAITPHCDRKMMEILQIIRTRSSVAIETRIGQQKAEKLDRLKKKRRANKNKFAEIRRRNKGG